MGLFFEKEERERIIERNPMKFSENIKTKKE